ncbi:MAG: hypothetical protein II670_05410 [Alphaproteobacteria bacterium]|nr:hypothetical protein [Alphaproteobacteria bacterium]
MKMAFSLWLLLATSMVCIAQTYNSLSLPKEENYCNNLSVHKWFGKKLKSVLMECTSEKKGYYRLDSSGEISEIVLDNTLVPISFYADDTLLVWHTINNQYLLYNTKQCNAVEITVPALSSILFSLPQYVRDNVAFNQELTECVYWNDSVVVRLKHNEKEKIALADTVFSIYGNSSITNVMYICNTKIFINIFDEEQMKESTYLCDISNDRITKRKCDFLVDDCLDNYCIAWKDGICVLWKYDNKTDCFEKKRVIFSTLDLYGRVGFVSDDTIAWYTGLDLDYNTFEPLLSQQGLLIIVDP